jgi:hypothetical protein
MVHSQGRFFAHGVATGSPPAILRRLTHLGMLSDGLRIDIQPTQKSDQLFR